MKPTEKQRQHFETLKEQLTARLDEIAEEYEQGTAPRDRNNTDQRMRLNDEAESMDRGEIAEAELRDRITEEQAEELREAIHDHAGSLHPSSSDTADGNADPAAKRRSREQKAARDKEQARKDAHAVEMICSRYGKE